MAPTTILWDLDDDPDGNVAHIAEHGLTKQEVEKALKNQLGTDVSRSSGHPIAFGITDTSRIIAVVYEEIDKETIYPITAFEVEER